MAVTAKGKSARQKRTIRCQASSLKSVCREMPRGALAAAMARMYRLRMNLSVQA
jgi:hypothetical protein